VNYGQIKAAVQAYIARDDSPTVANIPNAIAFAQSWLSQTFAPQQANKLGSLVFTAATQGWAQATLPARFGRFVLVAFPNQKPLDYVDPRTFLVEFAAGTLAGFTVANGQVLVAGANAGLTALTNWIEQPSELVADADSNYLTATFPDLLTWAAVAEQHRFNQDWEEVTRAEGFAAELLRQYQGAHVAKQQSGGRMIMKGAQ
jgi:hypothetical protein